MSGLKPYREYKDGGVEWLGRVPISWEVSQLKRNALVVNGGTPTPDSSNWDGEVPWATPVDLNLVDGRELRDTLRTLTQRGLESGSAAVPADSVILSTRAPIGYSAVTTALLAFNQGCKGLVPSERLAARFLLYAMQAARAELNRRGQGTTFLELGTSALASMLLAVPTREEQAAITAFLDRETAEIDVFIADQEELIGLLAERRAAMHARYFHEAVQVLPSERRGAPFGTAIRERDVRVRTRERELMSVSIHHGLVPWSDLHDKEPTAESFSAYKLVEPGDVVLNRMRAFQGAAGVSTQHGMVSPDYAVFRVSPTCDPKYISELLRSSPMIEAIKLRLRGIGSEESGAVRTPRVNVSDLIRIKVELPSRADQVHLVQRLGDEVSESDAVIANAQEAIALSRERRAALISAAVTGKIDVRERQ